MRWATLDPDGRPTAFYDPDVHPELFEEVGGEPRRAARSPVPSRSPTPTAGTAEPFRPAPDRGGRVVPTEPPALPPEAQAAADRALLREAMLRDQLEAWIDQRATAPQGLSPEEIAALQRLRQHGPKGSLGAA